MKQVVRCPSLLFSLVVGVIVVSGNEGGVEYVYNPCPQGADPDDCPVPRYAPCKPQQTECDNSKGRRVQSKTKIRKVRQLLLPLQSQKVTFSDDKFNEPLPYDQPCYSPSRKELETTWNKWEAEEDSSVLLNLTFPFNFFGKTYYQTFINDNGILTFGNTFKDNYQPSSLPSGLHTPMIAPFWADAEVASNGGLGDIWYRDFGGKLAVIWDEVGYYSDEKARATGANSFQVVLSQNQDFDDMNNICFCYLDMSWTHGDKDGSNGFEKYPRMGQSRAATVGITSGLADPFGTTTYSQIGRFNTSGYKHNGVRIPSGVDWLDYLGSTKNLNARTGFCFNSAPNMPPIFKGGPLNGKVTIPCGNNLEEYKVYFGAPEFDQSLTWEILKQPDTMPEGFVTSIDGDGSPSDTLGIRFEWLNIDFDTYEGRSFDFTFRVCDNVNPPACTTESISFELGICTELNVPFCFPGKCAPITDSTCRAPVGPSCTAWLSDQHCDAAHAFPMLISTRYPMIKESLRGSTDILGENGWWFHYTDDRAGGYAFTTSMSEAAPQLLCCVTSVDELLGTPRNVSSSLCFDGTPNWTDPIVIRAEGHHGGTGVFVLPSGLDVKKGVPTPELSAGIGNITIRQIRGYLNNLSPTPKKFLVEKFIAGSGSGASAKLPNEYKFHMFNGKIGSISLVLNPGQPCACYGEYSEDWECLHYNGCFRDQLPFGKKFGKCNYIDYPIFEGSVSKSTVVKGHDLCSGVPPPQPCVFERMKVIAKKLSEKLGVYARIDMFVTDLNEVYVQEYTFNHLGGTKHCIAKFVGGCVDSCFMGQYWAENGGDPELGGPLTDRPPVFLDDYGSMTDEAQCQLAIGQPSQIAVPVCTKEKFGNLGLSNILRDDSFDF